LPRPQTRRPQPRSPRDAPLSADDYTVMGRVIAPYGVKGWVKVHAYTEDRATLLDYAAWWIRPRAGSAKDAGGWREYAVEAARAHGASLIAQLAGIGDREAAALLKGADIGVPRAALPAAKKDEIYYTDLVGLAVMNRQGVHLGRVARVQDFGARTTVMALAGVASALGPNV